MKKLFSLVALALLSIESTWADSAPTISGITVPDAPTVTLDLSNQKDFTADESGWIVFSPKAEGVEKKDYWTYNATNGNNRTWAVPSGATAPFVGSGGAEKTSFALQTARVHALRFTGAETFSVLGKSGGTGRYVQVSLYTYDGTTFTLVGTESDKTNNVVELFFTDLNTSTNYVAYFYGSDTNNSDLYEVAIKSPSTAPSISAADATIKVKKSGDTATEEIGIEGANLTGSTLTATLSPAVDGLSVTLTSDAISSGAISTAATLSYTPTADANGTTTLTLSDGAGATKEVTITYVAKLTYSELETISEATIWNFDTDVTGAVEFTGDDQKTEYVYADIPDFENLTFTDAFNAKALAFKGQYPFRGNSNRYAMNGTLHFKTLYPGYITVKFSDTGTSASNTATKRYLVVNDEQTEYWTSRQNNSADGGYEAKLNVEAKDIYVPAGDVTITGSSAITVSYLSFTPATTFVEVSDKLYRTFASSSALDFTQPIEGLTAYAAIVEGDNVTFEPITGKVPAKTGMLLKADAPGKYIILKALDETTAIENNAFIGVAGGTATAEKGSFVLYAGNEGLGFYQTTAEAFTVGANTAYIPANVVSPTRMFIPLTGGETTGVDAIETVEAENVKFFDLQGRQVSKPTKGLYISNGKKYIVK